MANKPLQQSSAARVNDHMASGRLSICHLAKYYAPAVGGIETHVRLLALGQARQGADVQVVCMNHADRNGRDVGGEMFTATPTVEEIDGPVRLVRVGRRASLARWDLCPGLGPTLRRVLRSGVDIVHLHVPNPTMLISLATRRTEAAIVIGYHSDVVRQKVLAQGLRPFERNVFSRASLILATSPVYQGGSRTLQRYARKVDVLSFGIDLNPCLVPSNPAKEFAERLRREQGSPLWLSVGRLVYYKGLHIALRALANVPGKLLIVGSGPLDDELRSLADSLGVSNRVIWAPHLTADELTGAFLAAKALWFPSNARSEAFGFVQAEAMACGCPTINADIPYSGVPWVSQHGVSGLTVPVNDPESFAAAAHRLLSEPGLHGRLSDGARQRAIAEFDQHGMVQRSLAFYTRALTERGRQRAANGELLSGVASPSGRSTTPPEQIPSLAD
jgi:rhamnosyl/mannosyltransferase